MTTTIRRNSKEWKRIWAALAAAFGDTVQEHNGEVWQYMGCVDGQHEFRHRWHPQHGRIVWSLRAA